ncbi:MAG: hypothetical protein HQM03_03320 [Magnetococcales bacterium]|nr:hypothetical protein [Magnetococcales bacterium]
MSNPIAAAQLLHTLAPVSKAQTTTPQGQPATPNAQDRVGLFDQYLTQAERDYIANRLQDVKWMR